MPPLLKLILSRLGLGVLTLFLVSVVVFAATQALPGDPARAILGKESADKAMYNALRAQLHLDRPIYAQYGIWLEDVVTGNMGNSTAREAGHLAAQAARRELGPPRLVRGHHQHSGVPAHRCTERPLARFGVRPHHLGGLFGAGRAARVRHRNAADLRIRHHHHPRLAGGFEDRPEHLGRGQLNLLVLPALTLVLAVAPYISRILRASMIEVLESEYVQMARLKGHAGAHRDVTSCAAQRGDPRDPGLGPAARLARRRRGRRRVPVQLSRASVPRSSTPWPTATCRWSRRSCC